MIEYLDHNKSIFVTATKAIQDNAEAKALDLWVLKNSIRNGEGNFVGFIGEEMVLAAFPNAVSDNSYQHDIVIDGIRYEIKTKDRTIPMPRPDDECSVAVQNAGQKADRYIFVSVYRDKITDEYIHGHIMGYWPCATYKDKGNAVFRPEGWYDERNRWRIKADCYNMEYAWLYRMEKLWDAR